MIPFASRPSLSSILGGFKRTLTDLDSLIQENSAQQEANTKRVLDLMAVNRGLSDENAKASEVSLNIRKLIGG